METTTSKFMRETELTAENCMKRVPEEVLSNSLNGEAKEDGCPVCGGWNYPGGLCMDCREHKRRVEEQQKQAARRRAFGGWEP